MASSERELQEQLKELGERLVHPPSNVTELLPLLDQVENCLSRVEQSPSKSMQNALCPSMKALVADDLLRHSDIDVKVAVASCITEITRITAPDAPYDDEQMKEIFQLIVGAFEKLFDTSSSSYSKRVSILETVAKVRSCVVMLDLECDALILEMFQHFLKAIRDDHPANVFSAMETIMTLVLEESEDISVELLSSLLNSVKNENQDVLPIAQKLGKKVIGNCAAKLKPYMSQAVESLGISVNDYSDIVASVCRETSDVAEHDKVNASGEHQVDESKSLDKAGADEAPQETNELPTEATGSESIDAALDKSPKSVMSNGNAQTGNDDSLTEPISPRKKSERSKRTIQSKNTDGAAKSESGGLESEKTVKPETKPDQATKKPRGRKSNSLMNSSEGSDRSRIDHEKEIVELSDRRKSRAKEADSATSEGPPMKDVALSSEPVNESQAQASFPAASASEAINITSSPTQTHTDEPRSRKGRRGPKKKGSRNQEVEPGSPPKGALVSDLGEDGATPSAAVSLKKDLEGMSDSEAKPHKRRGKKAVAGNAGNANEKTSTPVDIVSKKESGATSDSDVKPLRKSGKKIDEKNTNEDESSGKQKEDKKKRGRGKTVSDKDVFEESSKKVTASSPKSATKSSNKNESQVEDTPNISSKRKRTPGKEDHGGIEYGEKLVGSKIKVYWPQDRLFYEGVITSFDPVKMKHKVSYTDGDVEVLNLRNQRWQFIREDDVEGGQEIDLQSPDASSDVPRKKKAKTNSDSSTKQGKADASAKRPGDVSASKSKSEAAKSGGKSKEDVKLSSKSKDDSPKTVSKSKDDSPKTVNKSKVENPKTGGKLKEDAQKSGSKYKDDTSKIKSKEETKIKSKEETAKRSTKSKGETPKTGGKTSANGMSAKGKSSSSKLQENEDSVKGKTDSAKAQESETKSGKKRGRRVNG